MTHLAWVPEQWLDKAPRRARRHGRAASVADDPARPRLRRRHEPHRRDGVARALRDPRRRAERLLGGDRAAAARHAREGARVDRRAAPHLRPAGVPALARRAAVGRAGARAARRPHRPAHRRLDGVGRPAVSVQPPRAALRARRGLRHRLGADVALAHAARVALARDRRRAHDPRARHAPRRPQLLAGWLRSRLDRDDIALEHVEAERLEGIELDGEPAPFPPGDPPQPSDVLSDELDRFTRDRVYEAAVRATIR